MHIINCNNNFALGQLTSGMMELWNSRIGHCAIPGMVEFSIVEVTELDIVEFLQLKL